MRQGRRERVANAGEIDELQIMVSLLDPVAVAGPEGEEARRAPAAGLDGEADILGDAEVGEEIGDLEGAADAALRPPRRPEARNVLSLEQRVAGVAGIWPDIRLK